MDSLYREKLMFLTGEKSSSVFFVQYRAAQPFYAKYTRRMGGEVIKNLECIENETLDSLEHDILIHQPTDVWC